MLSWLAGAIELFGIWKVGCKDKKGFVYCAIGNILWIIVSISNIKIMGGLLIVVIPVFFLNMYNFFKWGKYEK